jgi:squalene-associated FAD-dependent desaturase
MSGRTVVVVGGGLAGITAALRCADAGLPVTLHETRRQLGGLTYSFRRGNLTVDNGQHVFLRCCTAYLALLERLGVRDRVALQARLAIPVRAPGAPEPAWIRASAGVPAPYHLARSLLGYRHLPLRQRLRLLPAARALREVDPADPATDRRTFGDWLRGHGQSQRAVTVLWDLITVAALNARADETSLALAASTFQTGLLTDPGAAAVGWSRVPLSDLHAGPALAALEAAGVEVRLRSRVRGLERVGAGWAVGTDSGQTVADQVVVAVPPDAAEALLPARAVRRPPGWGARLGSSPIINLHVRYAHRVLDEPFIAAVDSPVQWVFDRSGTTQPHTGQYVAVSMSAARQLVDRPTPELCRRLLPAVAELLPAARGADVLDAFVTRERAATFLPAPGTAADRPTTTTDAAGLHLAGAWTATGWPATMEGAVRSGNAAAAAVADLPAPMEEAIA